MYSYKYNLYKCTHMCIYVYIYIHHMYANGRIHNVREGMLE